MGLRLDDNKQLWQDISAHIGHKIQCVRYGPADEAPWNIAIECHTCYEVLVDCNNPEMKIVRVP